MEATKRPAAWDRAPAPRWLVLMSIAARDRERQAAEVALLGRLRERKGALSQLLAKNSGHWGYEDPVCRFYHAATARERLRGVALPVRPPLADLP